VYKVFVPARKNFLALSGTGFSVGRMCFAILKNQRNTFICVALIVKDGFLSYYPLKQGLKQDGDRIRIIGEDNIFILLSIKTRIETFCFFRFNEFSF